MAREQRRGRGRLSSIDLLPEWADESKLWAFTALKEGRRTQVEILAEFNERLAAAALANGIGKAPKISLSAFNRRALRLAAMGRRLEETREIAGALTDRLGPGEADELTVMVAETIKTLVFEILEDRGEGGLGPKGAMELARALQAAVSAQSVSAERRRRIEAELKDRASAAIDKAAKQAGLSAEQIARIRRDVLGVRT
jgi:hypothetical protein